MPSAISSSGFSDAHYRHVVGRCQALFDSDALRMSLRPPRCAFWASRDRVALTAREESTTMLAPALKPRARHAADMERHDQQHIAESDRRDALTPGRHGAACAPSIVKLSAA